MTDLDLQNFFSLDGKVALVTGGELITFCRFSHMLSSIACRFSWFRSPCSNGIPLLRSSYRLHHGAESRRSSRH